MIRAMFVTLVVTVVLATQARADECIDLVKSARDHRVAAEALLKQADDLRNAAQARFETGASPEQPLQQAHAKMLEARKEITAAIEELDKGAAQNCEPSMTDLLDGQKDDLDVLEHVIQGMQKSAPLFGIKLSPTPGAAPTLPATPANPIAPSTVREVQTALQQAGLYRRHIDGKWGPRTKRAVKAYQQQNNLPATGTLDQQTLTAMKIGSQ